MQNINSGRSAPFPPIPPIHPIVDRFISRALILLFLLGASAPDPAHADPSRELERRALYVFEQCASTCQVELDRGLLRCPEYSDESDNVEAEDCRDRVREQYRQCLAMCPADPSPDQF